MKIQEVSIAGAVDVLAILAKMSPIPAPPDIADVLAWCMVNRPDYAHDIIRIASILSGKTPDWIAMYVSPVELRRMLDEVSSANQGLNELLAYFVQMGDADAA